MPISDYATSAASNTSLFPEGMSPAGVNDGMRQVQADERAQWNDFGWFNYGNGSGTPAYTYVSGSQFRVTGDATAAYHAKRRVKAVGSSTGTIYGSIASSSFSGGNTTVSVTWDSGSLVSEPLTIYLALPATGGVVPAVAGTDIPAGLERSLPITPYALAQCITVGNPGAIKLPGLTIRFGNGTTTTGGLQTVTYAEAFGGSVYSIQLTVLENIANYIPRVKTSSTSSFSLQLFTVDGAAAPSGVAFFWLAIGAA